MSTKIARAWDYSALSTFAECGRRGYYSVIRNLRPRDPAVPLHAGSALHAALYELHMHGWDLERALKALEESWGDFRAPATSKWSFMSLGHLQIVIENYAEDWRNLQPKPLRLRLDDLRLDRVAHHEFKVDDDGFVSFAEMPLVVDFDGLPYGGKIDLPTEDSMIWIEDYKCTSQWLTEWWAQRYGKSMQLKNYVNMVRDVTGLNVAGARVRGIYMGKEAGDEPEKWKRRTSSRSAVFGPYIFSPAELKEAKEWAHQHVKLVEFYEENDIYPMNDRACQFCEFKSICHTTPPLREGRIRQDFVTRELTGVLASGADSDD